MVNAALTLNARARYYQCERKIAYETREQAKAQLRRGRGHSPGLQPYHCPHCGQWHVGHKRMKRRRV